MHDGGDDAGVANPEEFPVVGKRVEEVPGALVYVIEVFPAREAESAKVLHPGVHLVPGDGRQLLAFPCPEVDLLDGVHLFDGEVDCLGDFFGEAHTAQ